MTDDDKIYLKWPTPIGVFDNKEHKLIKPDLIKFFEDYKSKNLSSRKATENLKLYESNYDIQKLGNPFFTKLMKFFANSIAKITTSANQEIINKIKSETNNNKPLDYNIIIEEAWFIIYEKGGFVRPHIHGSTWSLVYYVQIPESKNQDVNEGDTYFLSPIVPRHRNDFASEYNKFQILDIKAKEGNLVIWPSHLVHGSMPININKKRIIVSANASVNLKKE